MSITAGQTALASDFVSASSGASDSGKVPKLDSLGKIAMGFLDLFPPQLIALLQSASAQTQVNITSNSTGSVLYVALFVANSGNIYRLAQDARTRCYYITHTSAQTFSGGSCSINGIAVLGNYLYEIYLEAAVGKMKRYDAADLTNVTSITISGTNDVPNGAQLWADSTQLYMYSSASTHRIYTISGTTATAGSTVGFTSSGTQQTGSICNGTYVWIADESAGSGTISIRKYAIAGGAAVSTTTMKVMTGAVPRGAGLELFLGSANILGIGFAQGLESNTAIVGTAINIFGITLP